MIKKTFIPILFILLVNFVSAQRFEGGILAGFNASQVEGDTYKGFNKPGVLAGFYVRTDVTAAIFAGMEIKYSQKGARNKIKPKDPVKYIMRLDYIDLPFYMGFRTNDRSAIIAGVSANYLMRGKEINENGDFQEEDQNIFKSFDLQPFLGFQFDFLEKISVDLRFGLSILPLRAIQGIDGTTSYWHNNQFNNVISLAFYYRFNR